MLGIREGTGKKQVLVEYRGLEDEEPVLWIIQEILEDVPALFREYLTDTK